MDEDSKRYYKNLSKSQLIFYCIVIIIGIFLTIYLLKFGKKSREQYKKLENNGVVDTAVIVRDFIGAKGKLYFEYKFIVKKDTLNGFLQYSPSNGQISVGDSVLIKYLPDNADEVNKIMMYNDYKLIKIK